MVNEDGKNLKPFNQEEFEKAYKDLPKKHFPPTNGRA
jgi:hypothetical protein